MTYYVSVGTDRRAHLHPSVHAYYGECGAPLERRMSTSSLPLGNIVAHVDVCEHCIATTQDYDDVMADRATNVRCPDRRKHGTASEYVLCLGHGDGIKLIQVGEDDDGSAIYIEVPFIETIELR